MRHWMPCVALSLIILCGCAQNTEQLRQDRLARLERAQALAAEQAQRATVFESRVLQGQRDPTRLAYERLHDGEEWDVYRVVDSATARRWCAARTRGTWLVTVSLLPTDDDRLQFVIWDGHREPKGPRYTLRMVFFTSSGRQHMDVDAIQTGEYSVIQLTDTQSDFFRNRAEFSKSFALFEAQRFRESPDPMITHEIGVLSFAGFDDAMAVIERCSEGTAANAT